MFNFNNILLWRHADAEPLTEGQGLDIDRPLSKKGLKQAQKMATWLSNSMPKDTVIISSNALRAEQTTQALHLDYVVFATLAPEATLEAVLKTVAQLADDKLQGENLLIIGHQPWLGLLAAQLLTLPATLGANAKEISIKKGAVWWFKQPILQKNQPFKLLTVQSPSLL